MINFLKPIIRWFLTQRTSRLLCALFCFALCVRFLFVFLVWGIDRPIVDDGVDYHRIAVNLVDTHLFSGKTGVTARRPPLYPFFISWIYQACGISPAAVRIVQILLSSLIPLLIFSIGKSLYSRTTGLIGAMIACIYPVFIFLPGRFLTENVFLVLVTFFLWYCAVLLRPTFLSFGIAGGLAGLCILTRPSLLLIPPFMALWIWWNERRAGRSILLWIAFLSGLVLMVSPWTIRNYLLFNQVVLVTTNSGITFMHDNNPYISQLGWAGPQNRIFRPEDVFPDLSSGQEKASWVRLNEAEQDRLLFQKTLTWIRQNPLTFVSLLPRKLISFFNFRQASNTAEVSGMFMDLISFLSYGILAPFMFLGFGWTLKGEGNRQRLLHIFVFTIITGVLLYAGSVRLRVPLEPCLILFGAYSAARLLGFDDHSERALAANE